MFLTVYVYTLTSLCLRSRVRVEAVKNRLCDQWASRRMWLDAFVLMLYLFSCDGYSSSIVVALLLSLFLPTCEFVISKSKEFDTYWKAAIQWQSTHYTSGANLWNCRFTTQPINTRSMTRQSRDLAFHPTITDEWSPWEIGILKYSFRQLVYTL